MDTHGPSTWMNNPDLDLVSMAYGDGDKGIFVRFRDDKAAFVSFAKFIRSDDLEGIEPDRAHLCTQGNALCIPLKGGGDYSIDHLAIRASMDLDTFQKLKVMERDYAKASGHTVRKMRRNSGWTQTELSHRSGLDQAVISKLERGVHSPRLGTLDRIARAFGVDAFHLLEGSPPSTDANT